jgi:hypothetical protein
LTGELNGTVTESEEVTIVIEATDSYGCMGNTTVTFDVVGMCYAITSYDNVESMT